jgi:hypothetical protein
LIRFSGVAEAQAADARGSPGGKGIERQPEFSTKFAGLGCLLFIRDRTTFRRFRASYGSVEKLKSETAGFKRVFAEDIRAQYLMRKIGKW